MQGGNLPEITWKTERELLQHEAELKIEDVK